MPEPDAPLTCFKLKEVYIKEQKGPVSAITHVLGFLVTAVGQKVISPYSNSKANFSMEISSLKDLPVATERQRSDWCRLHRYEHLRASDGLHQIIDFSGRCVQIDKFVAISRGIPDIVPCIKGLQYAERSEC